MCTAVTLQTLQRENFFGRNKDFSYPIEPSLYLVPKGSSWTSVPGRSSFRDAYSSIGIGQESDHKATLVDGVNEHGFAAAALYFAGYASFAQPSMDTGRPGRPMLAAMDVVRFLLGRCAAVQDLRRLLSSVRLVGAPDPVTGADAPLHWIATDRSGACAVIEQTEEGLHVWNNPIGVLANSPDLRWQMTNLRNYMSAEPAQKPQAQWGRVTLTPFGSGCGTELLPGGYASPARFVRTAYQKSFTPPPANRQEAVSAGFHLLEGTALPKGPVAGSREPLDFTHYTALLNTASGEYFFRTYDNCQVTTAKLPVDAGKNPRPVRLGALNRQPVYATL